MSYFLPNEDIIWEKYNRFGERNGNLSEDKKVNLRKNKAITWNS
jgi:hypothetical protein